MNPQKDFLLGQKAGIHSCWASPSYLPHSTAGGTARESHHRAPPSVCPRRTMVLQGGDSTSGTGDSHPDTKGRQGGSRRRPKTEETTGCPESKVCHGAKHPVPKFPTSPPSQDPVPGDGVPCPAGAPRPPPSLCLQRGPAGRSCCILFFMKRLRKKHHLPLPSPRRKDAFNEILELVQRGSVQGSGEDGERLRSLSKAFFSAKPRAGAVSLRDKSGPK